MFVFLMTANNTCACNYLTHRTHHSHILFALTVVSILSVGCGQKSSLGTVRGTVTLDGKPLPSGNIVTLPDAGRGARGVIHDGQFELGTEATSDGVVIGTHRVAISANEPGSGSGPEATAGKSLVPIRYSNPSTSGLTVEVKAGNNTPELKLTSP
jgi:hypothetical protein